MKHIQNLKLGLRKLFIMECFNRLKAAGYKLSLTEILCQLFQKHDINMFGGNPKKYVFQQHSKRLWRTESRIQYRGISSTAATSNCNYYHKVLHLVCCSSPRSASAVVGRLTRLINQANNWRSKKYDKALHPFSTRKWLPYCNDATNPKFQQPTFLVCF